MKTSKGGVQALELREGKRNKAYLDSKKIPTIGVGHTGPEVYIGLAWTDQQIEDALTDDLKEAEDCINKYVTVPLTQNQFDALVSFVFNIGVMPFRRSTVLKLLNEKCYDLAAEALMMWVKPPELKGRRESERIQFLK
jgi:lysozyme